MQQVEPLIETKPPRIVWSQTEERLAIHIITSSATSCHFYPRHLILTSIVSPCTKYILQFYNDIDHQPVKLCTKHDQWQMIFLLKEQKTHWPRLFKEEESESLIDIVYDREYESDLEEEEEAAADEDELIDFDKVLSSHGNKTGLEM
ncbi:unnamed protein product [Absidia cylindrospora]